MFEEAKSHFLTLRDLLRFAVSRFNQAKLAFGHGCTNALDEAAYLILSALHLPHDNLDPFLDAKLLPGERNMILNLIERRITERVPVAYLTHEAWLKGFRFYVDERVIIPRSFIAELLEAQFYPWIDDPDSVTQALDLCTGSGCLAILMAHAFPGAVIDAADISLDALEVARRNVAAYGLQSQVDLIRSDLFSSLAGKTYDLIVSNPPYVNAASMGSLPEEYLHEPAIALASGADGLDATRRILSESAAHLNPDGLVIVEIGHNRDALEEAFQDIEFTWLDTEGGADHVFLLRREQLTGFTTP
ncbi:MAG: 50S ribosomal protein L3 N(5)-glutamine methyltransferase [Burkholderiales bacterium]|nr:50S ribosomal protein L3 N(5)-glutamine methyltransferase [Burkholderiales bacterium]